MLLVSQKHKLNLIVYKYGGEGGIRTHGTVAGTLVFKTRALNHSTTSPGLNIKLDVPTGTYREFTKQELIELNELLKNSSKTFD